MSPRRKAADDATDASEPKKKRAPRKTAAKKAAVPFSMPPEPKLPPMIDIAPKPASPRETGPAPAPAVTPPPPKPPGIGIPIRPTLGAPSKISIEPDIRAGEMEHPQDSWPPPPRKTDADLSIPPKVLLQSKRMPKTEVEDILEEPAMEHEVDREGLRPTVRTGMYRKIAVGFAALALIVGALVMYVAYAKATVTVHPRRAEVVTERVLTVREEPQGADEVAGEIAEVTVAGERSGSPSDSTVTDGIATGFVTLVNETDNDQTLVATTRLLSPDGVLFRLKSRVNVPANGRIKTEVYADQPGAGGDIGPTRFTIPGLNASLQKVIYGVSDAPMTGGRVTTGVVSQADIDQLETGLREEIEAQAKAELEKKIQGDWSGRAYEIEDMNRFVTAAAGETATGVTVRLTIRARLAAFDRARAIEIAAEDLRRGLTSDRELVGIDADAVTFTLEDADPASGLASLRVVVRGESRVSLESPLFDASKLKGLDLDAVRAYFEGIEGVERVEVKFRPFWIKRMPDLEDHIEFVIAK